MFPDMLEIVMVPDNSAAAWAAYEPRPNPSVGAKLPALPLLMMYPPPPE